MSSENGRRMVFGLAVTFAVLLASFPLSAMSVADYVDLSIARLEMARSTWSEEDRAPTEDEEKSLCESNGTSIENYHRYGGRMKEEIAAYLDAHPASVEIIQSLSDQIVTLIEQTEAEQ